MSRKLYQKPDLKGRRQAMAAGVIQRAMSFILLRNFPSLQVTVSGVELSADFHHAKVFVASVVGNRDVVSTLEESMYDIGRELKGQVKLPTMPRLKFIWDESFDAASKVHSIIESDG